MAMALETEAPMEEAHQIAISHLPLEETLDLAPVVPTVDSAPLEPVMDSVAEDLQTVMVRLQELAVILTVGEGEAPITEDLEVEDHQIATDHLLLAEMVDLDQAVPTEDPVVENLRTVTDHLLLAEMVDLEQVVPMEVPVVADLRPVMVHLQELAVVLTVGEVEALETEELEVEDHQIITDHLPLAEMVDLDQAVPTEDPLVEDLRTVMDLLPLEEMAHLAPVVPMADLVVEGPLIVMVHLRQVAVVLMVLDEEVPETEDSELEYHPTVMASHPLLHLEVTEDSVALHHLIVTELRFPEVLVEEVKVDSAVGENHQTVMDHLREVETEEVPVLQVEDLEVADHQTAMGHLH